MSSSASPRETLSTDLMARLGREDMTDVHLRGRDGVEVPAFRTILACRSDVLDKMLFGEFEEATSKVVELGYDGEVLRAVVEFCITDDVLLFEGRDEQAAARDMVQLIACAHFLSMPLLQDRAQTLVDTLLEEHNSLACIIYDEASLFNEATEAAKCGALAAIRQAPKGVLSQPGIWGLKSGALEELLSDDEMVCEEIILFRALVEWAAGGTEVDSISCSDVDRGITAKYLAALHIHLSSIRPTDLIGTVRESGLVDDSIISEALEAHALLAEKDFGLIVSQKRKAMPGVTVFGAGTVAVNGYYEYNGEHRYRDEDDNLPESWYISVIWLDGNIGDLSEEDVYYGLNQECVPVSGWQTGDFGREPCPCLRLSSKH